MVEQAGGRIFDLRVVDFSGSGGSAPRGQSLLRSFLAPRSFPPRPPGYVLDRTRTRSSAAAARRENPLPSVHANRLCADDER